MYDTLDLYYESILKFLMRFDHYLEMIVQDADIVQNLCPDEVLDYTTHCQTDELPQNCKVVAFPRSPKPHEIVDKYAWVNKYWNY